MNTSSHNGGKGKSMVTPCSPEILEDTLKSAGFEKIPEGMELEARFSLVNIYHVSGIVLQENEDNTLANLGRKYQDFAFGFGNNLNEIYQYLFHEDFKDDEEKWSKDNHITPPYLIIHISSNKAFTCESDFFKFKKETDKIFTLNSFSEAKDILKKKESEIIPKLITSLSIYFSYPDKPVQFIPISREICGKTNLGDIICSLRMQGSGNIVNLTNMDPSEVKVRIEDSIKSYNSLDVQIGSLFHAALREDSKSMKFLNFFCVLERHTHQVFKTIENKITDKYVTKEITKRIIKETTKETTGEITDEITKIKGMNNTPDRIRELGNELFLGKKVDEGGLAWRFYWCSFLAWEETNDIDINDFISMKDIRNKIAHGSKISESELPIEVAERLCLKILSITINP